MSQGQVGPGVPNIAPINQKIAQNRSSLNNSALAAQTLAHGSPGFDVYQSKGTNGKKSKQASFGARASLNHQQTNKSQPGPVSN